MASHHTHDSRRRRVTQCLVTVLASLAITATPATAAHDSLSCTPPDDLQPLFGLLDAITEVAFLLGVGLGTLGFVTAGLMIAAPFGGNWNRRGKEVAKAVLFGVTLLMSSNMIMSFLVSQLGGVFC